MCTFLWRLLNCSPPNPALKHKPFHAQSGRLRSCVELGKENCCMEHVKPVTPEKANKPKRGRPRKNGVQSPEILARTLFGLYWINKARSLKEKFESALQLAAANTNSSVTEMKRILAKWQPKDADVG